MKELLKFDEHLLKSVPEQNTLMYIRCYNVFLTINNHKKTLIFTKKTSAQNKSDKGRIADAAASDECTCPLRALGR